MQCLPRRQHCADLDALSDVVDLGFPMGDHAI
jgi:hypothetical protein